MVALREGLPAEARVRKNRCSGERRCNEHAPGPHTKQGQSPRDPGLLHFLSRAFPTHAIEGIHAEAKALVYDEATQVLAFEQ